MANKYTSLTKYISEIKVDGIGEWIIDKENDGTSEHPIHFPFVAYTEIIHRFIEDVYAFEKNNKDMGLTQYRDILEENNIEWGSESMKNADVSSLNDQCVMALIIGALRADRFCEGALFELFKNGSMLKWLERLSEIDNT